MKSFQFYSVENFPTLSPGVPVVGARQSTFAFVEETEPVTQLRLESQKFFGTIDLLRIESEIILNSLGYINREIDGKRERLNFTSYNHPVDFQAYYDSTKNILIIPQSKRISRAVYLNLNMIPSIALSEMIVDFHKVYQICGEYLAAWFRKVSSQVSAAGLVGNQIQDDDNFKKFYRRGELSNVTVPWQFEGATHRVMVTKSSAIVLQMDYRDNQSLELELVMDVFDKLLSQSWQPKPKRGRAEREIDIPVEP